MKTKALRYFVLVAMILTIVAVAGADSRTGPEPLTFKEETAVSTGNGVVVEPKGVKGSEIYLVQLTAPSLVSYKGGINGLAATNPAARGENRLNANNPDSLAYLDYLDAKRAEAISIIETAIGRPLDIAYEYRATLNGFAAEMTPAEAAQAANLPAVKHIERDREFELQTDSGPAWIGATSIWDGTATGGLPGTKGEGIVIGVIDTGIDPWNPSFADIGGDSYDHTNGTGQFFGVCDPTNLTPPAGITAYDPTFPCNDKLIGAWGYESVNGGTPRDSNGHGSHTASTAAGNYVEDTVVLTPTDTYTATISGVAPHANIIMYAACCTGAALSAARDQVVLDGVVDVVNYSIGADDPTTNPWGDINAIQWLAVREAGIFVATSAGNNGPGDETIGSPGDMPWLTTVGASSHNRAFLNSITLDDGVNDPITLDGSSMANGYGPAEVVFSVDFADPDNGISEEDARLCADGIFPPDTFSGQIVVCERGTYGRVAKGQTVSDGGAGGYILAQAAEIGGGPGAVVTDPHVLPAVHIDYATYQNLLAYIANAGGPVMGTIAGSTLDVNDAHGDIMAAFSSRGANRGIFADLIVPNVTAPGRDIWAAYHQGDAGDGDYTWNVISGTSMSSPHVAGAGALMAALHPDWTPAQIESALMTTSVTNVRNDDAVNAATPFAMGSGRVDLTKAAEAGLLMDVTTAEFEASNPNDGGDTKSLNIASMGNDKCVEACSWTRTVTATKDEDWTASLNLPDGMTGSVTPETFSLLAGESQEITVEVSVLGIPADEWAFGELNLTPAGATPAVHMPIGVQPNTGDLPNLVNIYTRRDAGSQLVTDLTAITITDLTVATYGLAQGNVTTTALAEDPTNDINAGEMYDDLDQVFWMAIDVPADTMRLLAEVIVSESPDLDMGVGFDTNGDGMPSFDEEVCSSATGTALERCDLSMPQSGTWWVAVLNWGASDVGAIDAFDLVTAVVPGSAVGNMSVEGPSAVAPLDPFSIRIFYDEDMNAGQYWYGAISLGTDAANPGNIGSMAVDLHRLEDDVNKTVSPAVAMAGDTVEFTITIQPNVLSEDLTYTLADTIPDGLTYVPGSATASAGSVTAGLNTLLWSGTQISPSNATSDYAMTTNATDALCDTGFGGYVDLEGFGILSQDTIIGDTATFSAFSGQNPFQFYGIDKTGVNFTDDGFAFFDSTPGATPWANTALPTPAEPNDLMAILWNDFLIEYDGTPGSIRGVSLASAGPDVSIIEYDDIEPWTSDGTSPDRFDFEVVIVSTIDDTPGVYEIVYAYDNFVGSPAAATVGIENGDGTLASEFLFGDPTGVITDGLIVCFDHVGAGPETVTITYQATVDAGQLGQIVNSVQTNTSNPGSQEEGTSTTLQVGHPTYLPAVNKS